MKVKYIYMLFIFLFFVISTYIYQINYSNEFNVKYVYNSDETKCKFSISNINESNDNYEILVYYPITEYEDINKSIMEEINLYIDNFKKNLHGAKNKLSITFDNFENENYSSFIFNVDVKNGTVHSDTYTFCYNIDNNTGKIFKIEDLINLGNNINNISEYIYNDLKQNKDLMKNCDYEDIKKYLNLDKEKYNNFCFSKEGIIFYFNPGTIGTKLVGKISVLIPNENIISN